MNFISYLRDVYFTSFPQQFDPAVFTDEELEPAGIFLRSKEGANFFETSDLQLVNRILSQNREIKNNLNANFNRPATKFETDKKIFKLKGDTIHVKKTIINRNALFNIYSVYQLRVDDFKVSMFARKKMNKNISPSCKEIAINEIKCEYNMLKKLQELVIQENRAELKGAFQEAPYAICEKSEFQNKVDNPYIHYFDGPLYKGDIFKFLVESDHGLSVDKILSAYDLLIQGIAFLQKMDIIHVDIKLENIFYEVLNDGTYQFRLGDFGGVCEYRELSAESDEDTLPHTLAYIFEKEKPTYSRSKEELHALSSFLLGEALFISFLRKRPFAMDVNKKFLDPDRPNLKMQKSNPVDLPSKVVNFIETLLDVDLAKRPTADALLHAWEDVKRECLINQPKP